MDEPVFTRTVPSVVITRTATTIAVPAERGKATISLGGQAEFTVSLFRDDVYALMTALLGHEVAYVSSTHPLHGRRLLNARPAGDKPLPPEPGQHVEVGPCELSLTLPDQRTCQAVFDSEQALDLVLRLEQAWEALTTAPPYG
jgi:hypothetical protein